MVKELAETMVPQEIFMEMSGEMLKMLLGDIFHADYVKEIAWMVEGDYDSFIENVVTTLDEVYSSEEQEILLRIYQDYPWMIFKADKVSKRMTEWGMEWGERISERAFKNLEETGALKKIEEEGFLKFKD